MKLTWKPGYRYILAACLLCTGVAGIAWAAGIRHPAIFWAQLIFNVVSSVGMALWLVADQKQSGYTKNPLLILWIVVEAAAFVSYVLSL